MHLGIFAKTFPRPTFEETLDAVADRGLTHVQFNMSCTGQPTLPDRHDQNHFILIARTFREKGLTMAAISGTFNLCDPDALRLADNLRRLEILAGACRWLDTRIITLCTGTREPHDMWKWHPENVRRVTWDTLVHSMRQAVKIADQHEVTLAFEPEINNVVNSVARARMLLDEIGSPWLKVVIDPANLMRAGDLSRRAEVLDEAFDWLGSDIVLAHAKGPEIRRDPEDTISIEDYWKEKIQRAPDLQVVWETLREGARSAAASHESPSMRIPRYLVELQSFYRDYIDRLYSLNYAGALILHGLPEEEVAAMQSMLVSLINHLKNK